MTGHTLILNKQTGDTLKTILRSNVLIRKMRVKHIKISNYRLFIFQMFTGSKIGINHMPSAFMMAFIRTVQQ